ncbi:MAG: hypothetical protein ACE5HD_09515 [Acidobacteriota bacterium]
MIRFTLEKDGDARRTPRRIALIRRETPARLLDDRAEEVTTAPYLLLREVILLECCVIFIAVLSLLFDAPLESIADPDHTPNPAKAAWYFLGLQELLHYFPPVVAGVLLPALVVLALVAIPYVRVNWEREGFYEHSWRLRLGAISGIVAAVSILLVWFQAWPVLVVTLAVYIPLLLPALPFCPGRLAMRLGRVPLADWIMTWFVSEVATLTLIGILFRGPGWAWSWPWIHGIY